MPQMMKSTPNKKVLVDNRTCAARKIYEEWQSAQVVFMRAIVAL